MIRFRALVLLVLLAAGVLATTTACRKPTPEERLEEALTLLQQNQTARGVMRLREIVRDVPEDPVAGDARLFLARYYVTEGDAARALEELRIVFESFPPEDWRYFEAFEGQVAIRSQLNDYETVLKLYDDVIEQIGDSDVSEMETLQVRRAIFEATVLEGEPRELAIAFLLDAMVNLTDDFNRGFAREQLANLYRQEGDYAASSNVYRQYLESFPDDSLASRLRLAMASNTVLAGEREQGLEEFETAAAEFREEFEQILDKNERASMQLELAGMYQTIREYDAAEREMRAVMADNPMSRIAIETQFGIASMYASAGVNEINQDLLERGLDLYAQIARENPGTDIEDGAKRATDQALQAFQSRVTAYEHAMAEQAAAAEVAAEDAATTETLSP